MKIIVALAFLLVGNNADDPEQSPLKLLEQSRYKLTEPIAHNALDEDESSQAVPSDHSTYIIRTVITIGIKNYINKLKQSISAAYNIPKYALSIKENERGFAVHSKNIELRGLDNINIDNIDVNIWGTKATIILRLPKIEVTCDHVGLDLTVFDSKLSAEKSGLVSVSNIVLIVNIIIDPIRLTVKDVDASLILAGPVQSKLNVQLFGADISRAVNNLVETIIPAVLQDNKGNLKAFLHAESVPYLELNEQLAHAASSYL